MRYKLVDNASLSRLSNCHKAKLNAQDIGDELEKIRKIHGKLLPEDVVFYAKNKRNPLHNYFNWDDEDAASRFRIEQARALIRSVEIVQRKSNNKPKRAFVSLHRGKENPGYESKAEILKSVDKRKLLVEKAERELEKWTDDYGELLELASIVAQIKAWQRGRIRDKEVA